jgi:hypothetical protein
MFQIFTITMQAMKAISAYIFEPHPAERFYVEARSKGEYLKAMGWNGL